MSHSVAKTERSKHSENRDAAAMHQMRLKYVNINFNSSIFNHDSLSYPQVCINYRLGASFQKYNNVELSYISHKRQVRKQRGNSQGVPRFFIHFLSR